MPFVDIRTMFRVYKKFPENKNIEKSRRNIQLVFIKLEKLYILPSGEKVPGVPFRKLLKPGIPLSPQGPVPGLEPC